MIMKNYKILEVMNFNHSIVGNVKYYLLQHVWIISNIFKDKACLYFKKKVFVLFIDKMTTSYLSAFNNLILKFNDDLIVVFPEENDFKVYRRGIEFLIGSNAKKVCNLLESVSSEEKSTNH